MAENKKSFVLYTDIIESVEELSNEDAGQLFKHILQYVNDENPETENPFVRLSFIPIKQSLKRHLEKWSDTRTKRSEAGKKSAQMRKAAKEKKTPISTKPTSVESVESESTKSTVNVSVSVSDNVNDNVSNKKDILLSSITFSDEVLVSSQYNRIAFNFWNLFKKNLLESGISKTKTLDKAKLSDWSKSIELMIEKDGRTIEEIKIVKEFLKTNDFWKKNILSTKKLREQFEKLYLNSKQANTNGQSKQLSTTEKNQRDSKARTTKFVEKLQTDINNNQED